MNAISTDILVVGAGPVGLFTIFEAGMMGHKCVCVDALDTTGGQLIELYPEKPIYDIPGFKGIDAQDLAANLKEQADAFDPVYLLNTQVSSCERTETGFNVTCGENIVSCKVIIIAAGNGMFTPRKPKIDGLEAYEDTSVLYSVRNKEQYRGKNLIVAGGGDSAVDWAVDLAPIANEIHVVHRRNEFRAADETVKQMYAAENVHIHTPAQPSKLTGENGQLTSVTIKDFDDKEVEVKTDTMLCFYGLVPSLGPLEEWDLSLRGKKIWVEPITQKTNQEGILAVGDVAHYDGKLELILTGFAEAAMACKTASQIIFPDKKFKLSYSTSQGMPGAA